MSVSEKSAPNMMMIVVCVRLIDHSSSIAKLAVNYADAAVSTFRQVSAVSSHWQRLTDLEEARLILYSTTNLRAAFA